MGEAAVLNHGSKVIAVAAEASTSPLTKDNLINYLASGCKPRDQWR